MEGGFHGGGGDEVSIMPVFTPVDQLLTYHSIIFCLLVLLLNLLILLFLSLLEHAIFKSI